MNLRTKTLAALAATTALAVGAGLTAVPPTVTAAGAGSSTSTERTLRTYAQATWRSMDAMTDKSTGLPTVGVPDPLPAATGCDVNAG